MQYRSSFHFIPPQVLCVIMIVAWSSNRTKNRQSQRRDVDETFTVLLIVRNVRNCKSAQYTSFKALTYVRICILWIIYVCVNNKWNSIYREEVEGRSHFIWWSIDRRYYPTAQDCCRMLGFRKGNNSLWYIESRARTNRGTSWRIHATTWIHIRFCLTGITIQ